MRYAVTVVSPRRDLRALLGHHLQEVRGVSSIAQVDVYEVGPVRALLRAAAQGPVVLVDLSDAEPALRLIERLARSNSSASVLGAVSSNSGDLILRAMRAGAVDFVMSPFNFERLEALFRRLKRSQGSHRPDDPSGAVWAFQRARGGNGATTVALHVAASVARIKKRRVLAMDLDLHSGTLDFYLRLQPTHSLSEALEKIENIEDVWPQIRSQWNKIDLLASPQTVRALPKDRLHLLPVLIDFVRRIYPAVVIDLPPNCLSLCPEVTASLDRVYVVTTPELSSLHLARRRLSELESYGLRPDRAAVVLNRFGSNKKLLPLDDIERALGQPVTACIDNDFETARSATIAGELVPPRSRLGRQFSDLARKILSFGPKEESSEAA